MGIGRIIIWILEILIVCGLLFAAQLRLRRGDHPVLRTVVFVVKILLCVGTGMLFIAVINEFSYRFGIELTAIYLALFGDIAASITEYVVRLIRKRGKDRGERKRCQQVLIACLTVVFSLCYLLYGGWNAMRIRVNTLTVQLSGLRESHRIAFVSDIHAGSARSAESFIELVHQINEEEPELVIFGGDITDVYTSYDEMVTIYRVLSGIKAPKYFIYGNHDRQPDADYAGGRTYTDEQLKEEIEKAGIVILADESIKVADDLVITGREEYTCETRKAWKDLDNPYIDNAAVIVVDHEPNDEGQLMCGDPFFQLSGHMHAGGQMWPINIIYLITNYKTYGEYEYPGRLLYVSSGVGNWMVPFRTLGNCEWDLITVQP